MKPRNLLDKLLGRKAASSGEFLGHSIGSYSPYGSSNPRAYSYYEEHQYDNNFSSIRVISNEFTKIQPYSIDKNGKPTDSRVIDKLYHPNQKMSAARFRSTLAIMQLVHPRVYLLAWHEEGGAAVPGGEITKDNIAGFTFLEGVSEIVQGQEIRYQVGQKQWTDKEVIVLGGLNPDNLSAGYSPSMAVRKWSRLDDYIADNQLGFFENGAVPQGQFLITASTTTEFNDIVNYLEKSHKGAGKNNNVTYAHQSVDPNTGKPGQAQITWIPFNQSNKDLDLSSIFDQVSQKLDSAFGVPASIRGVNEQNTYASVRVDEVILSKYVVDPFAMLTWSDFTHMMNYITGGLSVAITYDYEIPNIAEEDKLVAETKEVEIGAVLKLVEAGFSLDSSVDALALSPAYKLLKIGTSPKTQIVNDKPEVDEGGEVESSPNPREIDPLKSVHKHSEECGHEEVSDTKRIKPEARLEYELKLEDIAYKFMSDQINTAIKNTKAVGDPTKAELTTFTDDFLSVIVGLMIAEGELEYAAGVKLLVEAGIDTAPATGYELSAATRDAYRSYLLDVAASYSSDTATSIRTVLDRANVEGLSRAETEKALKNILNIDDYRIKRIARTEVNHSQGIASVDSISNISDQTGVKFNKVWHTASATACPFCTTLNGKSVPVKDTFLKVGATVNTPEGLSFTNEFVSVESASLHPNCRCYTTYEITTTSKSITKEPQEIHCKECDRYLGTANGDVKAIIKCSNSKCKADNVIEIGATL